MNTWSTPARTVEVNEVQEEIPPQVEEVEKVPQGDQVLTVGGGDEPPELSNRDIIEALLALAQAVTIQANLSMVPRVIVVEFTMTCRLRKFVRMNPPIFHGSKVGKDPQDFLHGVYKVMSAMGLNLGRRWSRFRNN